MRRNHPNTTNRKSAHRKSTAQLSWLMGAALIAINVGLNTIATPAEAAGSACEAAVTERLDRLNIEPADVRNISCLAKRRGGRDGGRVVGITAWVSLHSCQGNLVIDMSRHGQSREVYSRGACDLGKAVAAR